MLVEIEWHPTGRQLRVFGVSGLLASIVAALVLFFVWSVAVFWAIAALAAGAVLFLCSLISPRATRVLYLVLAIVGIPVGLAVSFIMLAAFYFLLLTPLALVFRLVGRDPLHRVRRKRNDRITSYWVPHQANEDPERYFHQF